MQHPTVPDEWYPIGTQFIDSSSSAALSIPNLPLGFAKKGRLVFVAVMTVQIVGAWIRVDGNAVAANALGGRFMNPGDYEVIYGNSAIEKVRVVRASSGGSVVVEYYVFRATD